MPDQLPEPWRRYGSIWLHPSGAEICWFGVWCSRRADGRARFDAQDLDHACEMALDERGVYARMGETEVALEAAQKAYRRIPSWVRRVFR